MQAKRGHRLIGSGATTIRIAPRLDKTRDRDGAETNTLNAGFRLFIGRKLWQDIGMPERVRLSGAEGKWLLEASDAEDSYKISGPAQDTIPRIQVGKTLIGSLGLESGEYTAQTYPLRHQILFWQEK